MLGKNTWIKLANAGTILSCFSLQIASVNAQVFPVEPLFGPPIILENGPGNGTVLLGLDPLGAFGSSITGDAFYDPIGPIGDGTTTFSSFVGLNIEGETFVLSSFPGEPGEPGEPIPEGEPFGPPLIPGFISEISEPTFENGSLITEFTFTNGSTELEFELTQTLLPLSENGLRTGSVLRQEYEIFNASESQIDFNLVRFADPDLVFEDNSISNGGGCLNCESGADLEDAILFATEFATNNSNDPTFYGITATGGQINPNNRFQLGNFFGLQDQILNGALPDNTIQEDSNNNQNQVDTDGNLILDQGQEFDVALALSNEFSLGVEESVEYVTETIFGGIAPEFQPEEELVTLTFSGDFPANFPFASFDATVTYNLNASDLDENDLDVGQFPIETFFAELFDANGNLVATSTINQGDIGPTGDPITAIITLETPTQPLSAITIDSDDDLITIVANARGGPPEDQTGSGQVVPAPNTSTGGSSSGSSGSLTSSLLSPQFLSFEFSFTAEGDPNVPPTNIEFTDGTLDIVEFGIAGDSITVASSSFELDEELGFSVTTTPVPEPSTALAFLSVLGLGGIATKRKIKKSN